MYRAVPITWPDLGDVRRVDRPSDAEVGDLDAAIRRDHQVAGLDVAVDDAEAVSGAQRLGRLVEDRNGALDVRRVRLRQQVGQRLTVDQLHHEKRDQLIVVDVFGIVVDVGDAGVRQAGGETRLGSEAEPKGVGVGEIGAEDLDRHRVLQDPIGRRPDLAHSADRDPVIQRVTGAQHRTDRSDVVHLALPC